MKNRDWKDGELNYLILAVAQRGTDGTTRDPKTIASYLRLQAGDAYRNGLLSLAAHIGAAATAINEDARNSHAPNWPRAESCLQAAFDED